MNWNFLGFEARGVYVFDPFLHHPIRLSTLVLAAAIVGIVTIVRRSLVLGLLVMAAWVTVFELAYSLTGFLLRHDLWMQIYPNLKTEDFTWVMIGLAGWAWLAHVKGARPDSVLATVAIVIFVVWMIIGHGGNMLGQPIDWREEALNVASKSLLGIAYLANALGWSTARSLGMSASLRMSAAHEEDLVEELDHVEGSAGVVGGQL